MATVSIEILNKLKSLQDTTMMRQCSNVQKGEMQLLSLLYEFGPLSPGDLVNKTHGTSAHVAKTILQLSKKKEVERSTDSNDRRKAIIKITEKGKERIEVAYKKLIDYSDEIISLLTAEEVDSLLSILDKISMHGRLAK